MNKVLILLLAFNANAACPDKVTKSARQLAAIYAKMNADPNLQSNSKRKDHVVVPEAVILKLRKP